MFGAWGSPSNRWLEDGKEKAWKGASLSILEVVNVEVIVLWYCKLSISMMQRKVQLYSLSMLLRHIAIAYIPK